MDIYIGADHRGFELKKKIIAHIQQLGHRPVDAGTHEPQTACDYPPIAKAVAMAVSQSKGNARGILLCMTGIGHSIAANKVKGAYAALVYNLEAAVLSREHNNANILVMGSKFLNEDQMLAIIDAWLKTPFEGGRHLRRTQQIQDIENEFFKA